MNSNKKNDSALMLVEIGSQPELDDVILSRRGLVVIDLYQEWCGPCVAMHSLLKKLKLDLGDDDLLKCVLVKNDDFDSFIEYKGDSEPTFLFYARGRFLGRVKGANAPLMVKVVTTLVEMERNRVEGEDGPPIISISDIVMD